jgi:hypothetical protein
VESNHWTEAWNGHDLDSIMTHYEDEIELTSPVAARLLGVSDGKANLRAYFQRGLQAYPVARTDSDASLRIMAPICVRAPSILGKSVFSGVKTNERLPAPHLSQSGGQSLAGTDGQCVGDRILHTICCSRTMDLGLHIAVHARKKSFLRHTAEQSLKETRACVTQF